MSIWPLWATSIAVLVACGATATVTPAPSPAPTPTARVLPSLPPEVATGELGDPGVMERIKRHVRVREIGPSWIRLEGDALSPPERDPPSAPLAVLSETRDKLRVVSEEDAARVAIWIRRKDAKTAIVRAVQLTDALGHAARDVGVWLEPGADVLVHTTLASRREISLAGGQVHLLGWVAAKALGTVWETPPKVTFLPKAVLAANTQILSAPSTTAGVLASVDSDVPIVADEVHDGWRKIELRRDHVQVRGFVPATAVEDVMIGEWGTIGLGTYSTSSHAIRIDVPPGICLYDRRDGEVVGVTTKQRVRLGYAAEDGWQQVRVTTGWGMHGLYLHLASADTFESCLP